MISFKIDLILKEPPSKNKMELVNITPEYQLVEHQTYTNPTLQDISTFMENPVSKFFFQKYLAQKTERTSILFLLWIYNLITTTHPELSPTQKTVFLEKCLKTPHVRAQLTLVFSGNLVGTKIKNKDKVRQLINDEEQSTMDSSVSCISSTLPADTENPLNECLTSAHMAHFQV